VFKPAMGEVGGGGWHLFQVAGILSLIFLRYLSQLVFDFKKTTKNIKEVIMDRILTFVSCTMETFWALGISAFAINLLT
jgi:hypothetical protein